MPRIGHPSNSGPCSIRHRFLSVVVVAGIFGGPTSLARAQGVRTDIGTLTQPVTAAGAQLSNANSPTLSARLSVPAEAPPVFFGPDSLHEPGVSTAAPSSAPLRPSG